MKLTELQYKNIGLLTQEIKKIYPEFLGFSGSKNDMKVFGIDKEIAIEAINEINLQKILDDEDKEEKRKLKKIRDKFKTLGFDNEDMDSFKSLVAKGSGE